MSGFSDYLENEAIEATLRGATYTGGAVYVALYTTDPTDADSGAELTDSGYVRQQAHASVVSDGFTVPSNGVSTNGNTVAFPAVVDIQVTITHWSIFDAQSGGNMLYHAPLTSSKILDPSDVLSFPVGSLSVTLS
jgi:hypothetical protein